MLCLKYVLTMMAQFTALRYIRSHYDSMQALCYILPHEHTALQHYVTLHLMRGGWGERLSYESDGDARPLA